MRAGEKKPASQLDALASQADAVEVEAQPGADVEPAASGAVAVQDHPQLGPLCFLLAASREVVCMVLRVESPRRTLDDAKVEQAARALLPVLDKYGLTLPAPDGPEFLAAVTIAPIGWTVWRELQAELQEKAKAAKQARQEAIGDPAASDGKA